MEFIVPQFIERETKILGPLNFKQTIFIVMAGIICVFIYFSIENTIIFFLFSSFVIGFSLLLVFYKKEGFSLPELMTNFVGFLTQSKIYLWKRKIITPKIEMKTYSRKEVKKETEEESPLKVTEKSHLGKLKNFLEIKTK